jgi:hypothetical protein
MESGKIKAKYKMPKNKELQNPLSKAKPNPKNGKWNPGKSKPNIKCRKTRNYKTHYRKQNLTGKMANGFW